ncbi:MAG TPA: hypothetical protein VFK35_01870 [Candidatus Limnocylindrales bacterium]|nr:hypothetical protein [Candidatus Limnocylindrales bacterium]
MAERAPDQLVAALARIARAIAEREAADRRRRDATLDPRRSA